MTTMMGQARLFWISSLAVASLSLGCRFAPSAADHAAKQYWAKRILNCDGSSFERMPGIPGGSIIQYRNTKYSVEDTGLTEADKLNGYEWKGLMHVTFSQYRVWLPAGLLVTAHWGDWLDAAGVVMGLPNLYVQLEKRNSHWFYGTVDADHYTGENAWGNPKLLDCSTIPKG